jgi:hypothetical protein
MGGPYHENNWAVDPEHPAGTLATAGIVRAPLVALLTSRASVTLVGPR